MHHYNGLTMVQSSETDLRREVEAATGREIPAAVWGYSRTMGSVADTLRGYYSTEDLIADIKALVSYEDYAVAVRRGSHAETEGETSREVVRREASAYPELDAVSEIMAMEASANLEVVGFRNDILEGDLVPPAAVAEWIGGESENCKEMPLSARTEEDQAAMADQVLRWREGAAPVPRVLPDWPNRSVSVPEDTLAYPIPGPTKSPLDFRERFVSVPARGPLWLLKFAAVGLMEEYPWSEAQSVGFVLSGVAPRLPTASITQYRLFPFRIVLDLDPGLDAKTVSSEYRKAQRELVRVEKRARPQSEKHLRLAVFVAQGKSGTWNDMMESWNSRCRPEWAYSNSRRFERDAPKALASLRQRRDRDRMPSPFRRIENTYGLR